MGHGYVVFSALYPPSMGGVELFTQNLSRELVRQGNRVWVVTSSHPGCPDHEVDEGVEVLRLPARLLLSGRLPIPRRGTAYGEFWHRLLGLPADRVVVNTRFYGHSLEGLRYAGEKGLPSLVIEHGSAHLSLGGRLTSRVVETYEHRITRRLLRTYKPRFAGVSKAACAWLGHFGIHTDLVVSNAIDAAAFRAQASSRDFRDELGLDPGTPLVVYAARLVPEKGGEAVVECARSMPEVAFALAGAGPLAEKLQRERQGMDNCFLVGRLGRPDMAAFMAQGDFFCLPSVSEGLPTTMLEAGAQGTLPVISDVGGVQDLLDGHGYGRVVPPTAEGISRGIRELLALGPEVLAELSSQLEERVETAFSWAHSVEQLEAAFEAPVTREDM